MKAWFSAVSLVCAAVLAASPVELSDRKYAAKDGSFIRQIKAKDLFCLIPFKINVTTAPGVTLVFDYRVTAAVPTYVAVNMRGNHSRMTYAQAASSAEWRTAVLPLDCMIYVEKGNPKLKNGDAFTTMNVYARNAGDKKAEGTIKLELKNVRFENRNQAGTAAEFKLPYTPGEADFAASLKGGATLKNGIWAFTAKAPAVYTILKSSLRVPYQPGILCRFEYRVKLNGAQADYVGVNLQARSGVRTFSEFPLKTEWSPAVIRFSSLQKQLKQGDLLDSMSIYVKCGKTPGTPTIEVRNLRFETDAEYDPLAGARVSYSAYPLFDWPLAAGSEKYRLQYPGRSVEVNGGFYVPPEPVRPGIIDYTVTALPSGKVIRQDRIFIPERNIHWKIPGYDFAVFAAKPHPRMKELAAFLFPNADAAAREAKKYARTPIPPEPQPYKEGALPHVRSWIEWYGKIADGVITYHGFRMRMLGSAAILTGDPELKLAAKKKLLEVIRWDPVNGGSAMKRCDLQAAWLLRGIVFCYDAAFDILSEAERAEVRRIIRIRGDQFWQAIHPCKLNDAQNHSWDKTEAAAFAALALAEEPGMAERFRFAANLFAYRFFPALGFEGENNEGLSYWSYGLGLAVRFVDVAKYTVHLDMYQQPWLRQTARFPVYCQPPLGYPVSFADNTAKLNHHTRGPQNAKFTAKLAGESGDPAALWYAGYPELKGVRAAIPLELEQSRFYPHIGWTVFNTFLPDGRENVVVGFHSGKYFAGHQHADQNSFVINAYGDKLAIDGGYYDWWGSKHFNAYSTQTEAHNCILADGRGQDVRVTGSDGKVTHYFDAPYFGYVSGDAAKVYQKRVSQFDRELLFVKPDHVFVYDRLAAPKPTVFSWLLHSHTDLPIEYKNRDFAIARPLAGLTGSVLLPRDAKTSVTPAYTVMPVNGYSVDPVPNRQKEWCFTAANAEPVGNTEFLAAMRIRRGAGAKAEQNWTVEENADAVLVKGKDVEVLFSRQPGKTVRLGHFVTDARCAAVILKDGKVEDFVKIGGKSMTYGQVKCTGSGDCAGVMKRPIQSSSVEILFCGRTVPLKKHTIRYPFGKQIHVVEGMLDIPEAGTYKMISEKPVHYIAAQGERTEVMGFTRPRNMRFYGEAEPDKPVLLTLEKGKMIFCVSSDQPVGAIRWIRWIR